MITGSLKAITGSLKAALSIYGQNKKNDHWLTQSNHWVTVIPPELETSKAVRTAVLFFHFNVILS